MAKTLNMTEDEILQYTQNIRKDMVEKIIEGGVPTDNETRYALLSALGDMDKQAMGNKKIAASLIGSESDRLVANALIMLGNQLQGRNPYEKEIGSGDIPEVDFAMLPATELTPGEDEQGISSEKYDEFMGRMEPIMKPGE